MKQSVRGWPAMASPFVYENKTVYQILWMEMNVELRNIIFFVAFLKSPAFVNGVIHYLTSFYPGSLFFLGYFDCVIIGAVNNVIVTSLAVSFAG
jgi:hypothetical protein